MALFKQHQPSREPFADQHGGHGHEHVRYPDTYREPESSHSPSFGQPESRGFSSRQQYSPAAQDEAPLGVRDATE